MSSKQPGSVSQTKRSSYYAYNIGGGPITNLSFQLSGLRGMSIIRNALPESDDIGLPGQGEPMKKEKSLDEDK